MRYPLITNRLSIEPLSQKDLYGFLSYRQDPEVARFQGWETTYSKQDAQLLIDAQAGVLVPSQDNWLQLAIHDKETGLLIGDLALHSTSSDNTVFEIGFTIARAEQGKGFAKEAAERLIAALFEDLNAQTVFAETDSRNLRSIALLQALGFQNQTEQSRFEKFKNEDVKVEFFRKSRTN